MSNMKQHADWRKPRRSSGGANNCVEVALPLTTADVLVRDTKDRAAGHIYVPRASWAALQSQVG